MTSGDRNINFFHVSIIVRRRRNKIEGLLNENYQWEFDQVKLKNMAVGFYASLYKADPTFGGDFIQGFFPWISPKAKEKLGASYKESETCLALNGYESIESSWPRRTSGSILRAGVGDCWDFCVILCEGSVGRRGGC